MNDYAKELVKDGLGRLLQSYLNLMNELDNEELVVAFENLVATFSYRIAPFAVSIVTHLVKQYFRLIGKEEDDHEYETVLTALASYTSMRRILDAIQDNAEVLI